MELNDIEVIYNLDESKNQRIFIFRPEETVQPLNIIASKNKNESYIHGIYIKKFLEQEYLDDEAIQNVKDKIIYSARSIISYLVNRHGNLIFAETTKDGSKRRDGIFFVPAELTQKQYDCLKENFSYFENFEMILLQECKSDDIATEFFSKDELEKLDDYFKNLINSKII